MVSDVITFVSHTNKPGGGELALRRYLEATSLPVRLVTLEGGGVWNGLDAPVSVVRGLPGLRSALRGTQGRLVVANSMRAAFLTALVLPRSHRLVYWVRDGLTDSAMSPFALALTKHVTRRRASHYLANSWWTAATVRHTLRVPPQELHVVHSMCGLGEEPLTQPERPAPHTPLRLLFLGRISPWKAPDVAVRALPRLRRLGVEATLTIAGGAHFGEERYVRTLKRLVAAEPTARIVGHVTDVMELLPNHDVLVHCSTAPEPFGQVIVQALAAGLPTIATHGGGPEEILASAPVPLLYEPGSPDGLALRIKETLGAYSEISAWAAQRAVRYSDARSRIALDEILQSIKSGRPESGRIPPALT